MSRLRLTALLGPLLAACAIGGKMPEVGSIETPGNTQVPLPPGQWTVLAERTLQAGQMSSGGVNTDQSIQRWYARLENGKIVSLVFVTTSAGGVAPYGYVTGADCVARPPSDYRYYHDVAESAPNAIDCTRVVGNWRLGPPAAASSELYRQMYAASKAYGGFPRSALMAEFAEAHANRFISYYAYFFPEQAGLREASTLWRADALGESYRRYVDDKVSWARQFGPAVRRGSQYLL